MADGVAITPGTGLTVLTDEVTTLNGGALSPTQHAQRIKLVIGADGSANDISGSNPVPVTSVVTTLPALASGSNVIGAVTQSGTWNIGTITSSLPTGSNVIGAVTQSGAWSITGTISLPTGASTSANQTTLNTAIGSTTDAAAANGAAGTLLAYTRAIKDGITDTTTPSAVQTKNASYETVAASQTDQVMGASGAAGDILSQVLIIPATTSPGAVSIKDGAGSAVTIFTGGASSVSTLIPFAVPLGIVAGTNWKITTGANVSAIGIGKFS